MKRALLTLALGIFVGFVPNSAAQDVNGLLLFVNSTSDSHDIQPGDRVCGDAGGQCTLRAAIEETNANSTRDAILFELPQPSVIDLTLGELQIVQNLDIVGPGARRLSIRRAAGASSFRIFHFPQTSLMTAIRGVTISGGSGTTGGGVLVENGAIVTLADAAVTGNQAQRGGGIYSTGTMFISRCLISGNSATDVGGGIANIGGTHEMSIGNSTVTANVGGAAGAIYNEGILTLANDTFTENTGTFAVNSILSNPQGSVRVINTIVGRDSALGNSLQGTFISGGGNIVTAANGSSGFTNGVNGDQVSNNDIIDPLLGPLSNNGGQTDTFMPLAGSPAILHGDPCVRTSQCATLPGVQIPNSRLDQRRLRRNPFSNIDVGAHDTNAVSNTAVGSFTLSGFGTGPASRHAGTIVELINPTTLERRFTRVRLNGDISFTNLPSDAFVINIRAKRSGMVTPLVFALD